MAQAHIGMLLSGPGTLFFDSIERAEARDWSNIDVDVVSITHSPHSSVLIDTQSILQKHLK